jgi:hypothetical protein
MTDAPARASASSATKARAATAARPRRSRPPWRCWAGRRAAAGRGRGPRRRRARGGGAGLRPIVAAGGDGHHHDGGGHADGHGRRFGVLPFGTFNYFARGLGHPRGPERGGRGDPAGRTRRCRSPRSTGRCSSTTSRWASIRRSCGRARTSMRAGGAGAWRALVGGQDLPAFQRPLFLTLRADGEEHRVRTPLLFVARSAYQLESFGLAGADCVARGASRSSWRPTRAGGHVPKAFRLVRRDHGRGAGLRPRLRRGGDHRHPLAPSHRGLRRREDPDAHAAAAADPPQRAGRSSRRPRQPRRPGTRGRRHEDNPSPVGPAFRAHAARPPRPVGGVVGGAFAEPRGGVRGLHATGAAGAVRGGSQVSRPAALALARGAREPRHLARQPCWCGSWTPGGATATSSTTT